MMAFCFLNLLLTQRHNFFGIVVVIQKTFEKTHNAILKDDLVIMDGSNKTTNIF